MLKKNIFFQKFYFTNFKFIFNSSYILFRDTKQIIIKIYFFKKIFIHMGCFSKCLFVFPKHKHIQIGSFKSSRKLYNSSIILRKKKR